jgi:alcohol dehydrogenase, propanol-preferring
VPVANPVLSTPAVPGTEPAFSATVPVGQCAMTAFRLLEWQQSPELVEVPIPEPGPGEVLLKVGGAGVCHSDLHLMEWEPGLLSFNPPFTLGHENAGWIAALGDGVTGVSVGDPVIVYGAWGCGICRACRESKENYCERQAEIGTFGGGLGLDGGMAEYMLIPSPRLLVPLGDLDPRDAAPLTDAALTPYHAIKRSLHKLVLGSTAVVIGCGGLGHMAVQILRALSPAQVIAIDREPAQLVLASEVGAHLTFSPVAGTTDEVRAATGGRGAELVLDFVGSDDTLALAATLGRFDSDLTVVGVAGGTLEFSFFALPHECSLATTNWGSAIELMEVIALARAGSIHAHVERFGLDQAAEAYDRLRRGEIHGRAVVCP